MKVVEIVLEKRLCGIVTVYEMQVGFVPEKATIDAVLKRLQKEYHAKGKKLCFVNIEKVFNSVPGKVLEWAMRRKEYLKFWLNQ